VSDAAFAMRASYVNRPAVIEHRNLRFVIMDAPTDGNVSSYIDELRKHNVAAVVRACEPTYSSQPLVDAGITVEEMCFPDGSPPPNDIVDRWLNLVDQICKPKNSKNSEEKENESRGIAVHCVAGLGRAPVLVAIALVDVGQMDPDDAIELIRKKRRGAINARQLKYIQSYKKRAKRGFCTIL